TWPHPRRRDVDSRRDARCRLATGPGGRGHGDVYRDLGFDRRRHLTPFAPPAAHRPRGRLGAVYYDDRGRDRAFHVLHHRAHPVEIELSPVHLNSIRPAPKACVAPSAHGPST